MVLTRTRTESSIDDPVTKRQKTESGGMWVYDVNKNSHLKGRRRFKADLQDLEVLCAAEYEAHGLRLKTIGAGEDDGSFVVGIENKQGKPVMEVSFLISDTSEYPKSHSLFCHSLDPDISSRLEAVLESVVDQPARPMKDMVDSFFSSVAAAVAPKAPIQVRSDSEGEDDEDDDSDTFDYDYMEDDDVGAVSVEPKAVLSLLQTNFVDTVGSSFQPGLTRISGGDDFVLSVSVPVISLAQSIPPRALMAWDRRLLSESQHLVLLISGFRGIYPVLENDGTYTQPAQKISATLSFKVGLSPRYKPGNEQAREAVRKHGLIVADAEDEYREQLEKAALEKEYEYYDDEDNQEYMEPAVEQPVVEEEEPDPERFDRFSLSSSLESLLDQAFLRVVQYRRKFGLGWAGAEVLYHETEKLQQTPEDVLAASFQVVTAADKEEAQLSRTLTLPHDPLAGLSKGEPINLPLTAFSYLIRRLTLCTKYCIVCHNKLNTDYEALKPYVCDSKLCSYQYYSMNRGPSLEYEIIHNTKTVDLLVSLAYVSAAEGSMEDPLPVGMGLRVQHPGVVPVGQFVAPNRGYVAPGTGALAPVDPIGPETPARPGVDGLVDFDTLNIVQVLDTLPPIEVMKKHLLKKVQVGKSKPKLKDLDPNLLPAAWLLLRWIVCSCTALIEEITDPNELIQDLDMNWKQFRLTVGAPDAEAKFKHAVQDAANKDLNAQNYPVLYAFHGSPLKNWHSIVRHGLWYRQITHGRAYGNGVYLAKDAQTSMGHYAVASRTAWKHSASCPSNCVALAEVVNRPQEFVSSSPYFVIADTTWIVCRYLLIKGITQPEDAFTNKPAPTPSATATGPIRYVSIDPLHKTVVSGKTIQIPDPTHQLESVLQQRQADVLENILDEEDMAIFSLDPTAESQSQSQSKGKGKQAVNGHYDGDHDYMDIDDDDDYLDDWNHDADYVQRALETFMPPPFESTNGASMALQKELRLMLKEQDNAKSLKELGWYMPPELLGDNLYQWIVEMHSFDPDIPIAQDLRKNNINSIIFEIRFPPTFPIAPPFFRIITPRFLPFIHGGGGHVTGGGSICMDLLTSNGWLPSYTIPAVLMQIKLAISNLEPRPARLSSQWRTPYTVSESLAGFKRAAATHNWTVPEGLDRLVR
ncbi:hypothetical protein FA13DRAFT_1795840 [Coprinellus micaceus]|uniref:UBC core domain-containing protein n=1 Tax=Coprinellus micaceus TaxID=71717 RepID=A0A4Y7SWF4_COPMI|nr:hypothetical protein FA13DRAFT_1795840 [Coprinellus micaceus]